MVESLGSSFAQPYNKILRGMKAVSLNLLVLCLPRDPAECINIMIDENEDRILYSHAYISINIRPPDPQSISRCTKHPKSRI